MSRARLTAVAVFACTACGHSAPFGNDLVLGNGPFTNSIPVRLTYNDLSDEGASLSPDGRLLVYSYERPGPDGDRCLGILPSAGGQRQAQGCEWRLDRTGWRDGLDQAALTDDGRVLFSRHRGMIGNLTSAEGGVYLGRIDSLAASRRVLPLLVTPPGGSAKWDDFREPVWLGGEEFLGLGAQRHLVNALCPKGCPSDILRYPALDTVVVGVELARLRLTEGVATVTPIAPAPGAVTFALDRANQMIYFIAQTPAPGDDAYREPVADTLFRVPLGGGTPEALVGWPRPDRLPTEHVDGLTVAGGRVYLSLSRGTGTQLVSEIVEVGSGGLLTRVATAPAWRWGRLRATADGTALIAELIVRVAAAGSNRTTQTDLYRVGIGP